MSNIQEGSITIRIEGPKIIAGNTYLAVEAEIGEENEKPGKLTQINIKKETTTAYLISIGVENNYIYDEWYLKEVVINSGNMTRDHAFKIMEDITDETQRENTST